MQYNLRLQYSLCVADYIQGTGADNPPENKQCGKWRHDFQINIFIQLVHFITILSCPNNKFQKFNLRVSTFYPNWLGTCRPFSSSRSWSSSCGCGDYPVAVDGCPPRAAASAGRSGAAAPLPTRSASLARGCLRRRQGRYHRRYRRRSKSQLSSRTRWSCCPLPIPDCCCCCCCYLQLCKWAW